MIIFFLMIRLPPRSTRTDTRFPYTTLFRSVYRANYLGALKGLSQAQNPEPLVRTLDFAQRWVAGTRWADLESTRIALERNHAFMDANEAENVGIRLRLGQDELNR